MYFIFVSQQLGFSLLEFSMPVFFSVFFAYDNYSLSVIKIIAVEAAIQRLVTKYIFSLHEISSLRLDCLKTWGRKVMLQGFFKDLVTTWTS